jgi:hypothetical protein
VFLVIRGDFKVSRKLVTRKPKIKKIEEIRDNPLKVTRETNN